MFLIDNETFYFRDEEAETAEPLLYECITLNCRRLKFLEGITLTPNNEMETIPKKLVNIEKSGIPGAIIVYIVC